MNKDEIRTILQKEIESFHEITIWRGKIEDNSIDCVPIAVGRDLLLIQYLYDFQIDGYKILRIKDITCIRSGKHERHSERILKEEGVFDCIHKPNIDDADSWSQMFSELMVLGKYIVVQCENFGDMYIGQVVEVAKTSLSMRYFDFFGIWNEETAKVLYKDITMVSFDDRYSTIISRYTTA